jgi:hypothetical protein
MVLPVAVEIAPADAPKEQVAVLLSACTRAKRGAECVLAADVPSGGTSAVAIVTWQGGSRALVEVGIRRAGRPDWRSRSLDFDPTRDDVLERWRAVGFVVGTLANEELDEPSTPEQAGSEPAAAVAEPPAAPPKAPVSTAPPTPKRVARPIRGRLDLGAAAGPALDAVRFGGLVRGELELPNPLRLQLTARYLERPSGERGLRAQWITASLGLGLGFATKRVEFGATLDGRGEYFAARAEQSDDAEAQTRWLSGVGLGSTVAWMPSPTLGLFVGGDLALMFGSTDVRVASEEVGRDEALRYGAEVGVRFRLR